jgi:general secretion pathway protein B
MSFILDALKKSESERQKQAVPGLMDMTPAVARPRFPRWAIGLCALLGINLLVLIVVLLSHDRPPVAAALRPAAAPPAAATPPAPPATAPPLATLQPGPEHFSPLETAPADAPEIPLVEPVTRVTPKPRLANDSTPATDAALPTLAEINQSGPRGLPELHLDIIFHAARPAERFVFINGRKYREGEILTEGPNLEKITRDAAILNYRGLRFRLPL